MSKGLIKVGFFRRYNHWDIVPWGWGLVYHDYNRAQGVCCPVPFNWVCHWAIRLYRKIWDPGCGFELLRKSDDYTIVRKWKNED